MATTPGRSRSSRRSSAAESWPSCPGEETAEGVEPGPFGSRSCGSPGAELRTPAPCGPRWTARPASTPRSMAQAGGTGAGAVLHQRRWPPGVPGRVLVRRLRRRRAGRARRPSRWRRGRRRRTRRWPTHAGPGVVAYSALGQADGHPRAVTPRYCSRTLEMPLCERFPRVAGHGLAAPASPCPASCSPWRAGLHAQFWCGPACPGQRAGGTAGCSPKKRMNSALASGPRGSV